MSAHRRSKRKQRERSLKQMGLARARALGCTCRAEAHVVVLPVGRSVYVKHERGCPRWESIRTDGSSLITGQLFPSSPPDDDRRAA